MFIKDNDHLCLSHFFPGDQYNCTQSSMAPVHVFLLAYCSTRNERYGFHSYRQQTEVTTIYNSCSALEVNL
jgi:hypothetical protein